MRDRSERGSASSLAIVAADVSCTGSSDQDAQPRRPPGYTHVRRREPLASQPAHLRSPRRGAQIGLERQLPQALQVQAVTWRLRLVGEGALGGIEDASQVVVSARCVSPSG